MSSTFTASTAQKAGGGASFLISKGATSDRGTRCCRAFPVIAGEVYSLKVRIRAGVVAASGITIRMAEAATMPVSTYVSSSAETSHTDLAANVGVAASWTTLEYLYAVPGGVFYASLVVINDAGGPIDLYFDDCSAGRQITATFLAANSIAVGTLAVQNGALVNAMIGALAVDDAKVANLSAAKLSVGTGIIGGNLQSSNYSFGSAGWIVQPGGYAEFGAASIRGQLVAAQIGAGIIDSTKINVSQLSAISANMGAITAGSITLSTSGYLRGGQTAYNTGTGFFLGYSGAAYKFSIGNGSTNALTWDGTTLTFTGALSGATGTFAGSLSAATGTFAGTLTAAGLTLAGHAIFTPDWASASSTVSSSASWATILTSGSINPGATGQVCVTLSLVTTPGFDFLGGGGAMQSFIVNYRVQRNGTTIATFDGTLLAYCLSDTPGASAVYTLQHQDSGSVFSTPGTTGRRTMLSLGVNR